jgi:hypothetical protein
MADTSASPLPSGLPQCRICGQVMAKGSMVGDSVRAVGSANLVWIDEKSDQMINLTDAGTFAWSKSPGIPGFKCDACGIIELHLQPHNIEVESWSQ